ncbi:hypothetical protein GCM10027093_25820 [Paraburkholderia jirisanensis]
MLRGAGFAGRCDIECIIQAFAEMLLRQFRAFLEDPRDARADLLTMSELSSCVHYVNLAIGER